MTERLTDEQVAQFIDPTWRYISPNVRSIASELLEYRRCPVGTTTKYPDMPFAAYEKLRLERDALLVENTQHLEQLEKQRDQVQTLRAALVAIANSTHQAYDGNAPYFSQHSSGYALGVADGHRCAANTARKALATEPQ